MQLTFPLFVRFLHTLCCVGLMIEKENMNNTPNAVLEKEKEN
jgi:hypothetical protein